MMGNTISKPQMKFSQPGNKVLSKEQFHKISTYMESHTGIKMPDSKHIMVQARLQARLKALNLSSFDEYLEYVFGSESASQTELISMVDVLTTNLTQFFRESQHFDYMTETVLPLFAQSGITRPEIWSAGCSTGQEPYTLSIVMQEFMRKNPGKFSDYSILATDLSTRVLEKASQAVYPLDYLDNLSLEMKKRYFLKSKDMTNPLARLKPFVRQKIRFGRLNFMDDNYNVTPPKNIIFCRNVLIYFDKPTQAAVIKKLVDNLVPGGYLFLGHSETIFGMDLPLTTVASTVFKKARQ